MRSGRGFRNGLAGLLSINPSRWAKRKKLRNDAQTELYVNFTGETFENDYLSDLISRDAAGEGAQRAEDAEELALPLVGRVEAHQRREARGHEARAGG